MSAVSPIITAQGARNYLSERLHVSRETMGRIEQFVAALREANNQQNLVSGSTLDDDSMWCRHIADSAQLLGLAGGGGGTWADLGSGAGLPGLVIALIAPHWRVTLVESRKLRCDFLQGVITALALQDRVTLYHGRVESLAASHFDVISARAFAPLDKLLAMSGHLASESTLWLLPKGKNAQMELSTLPHTWQKAFKVEPSITHGESRILIGRGAMLARKAQRS
ncbi:MAG: 16S rRNA (guanine(527)-N(7))-methyltransferase RsmG [Sphingopyxis sp.]